MESELESLKNRISDKEVTLKARDVARKIMEYRYSTTLDRYF